jgi:hypothetical protein
MAGRDSAPEQRWLALDGLVMARRRAAAGRFGVGRWLTAVLEPATGNLLIGCLCHAPELGLSDGSDAAGAGPQRILRPEKRGWRSDERSGGGLGGLSVVTSVADRRRERCARAQRRC